MKTLQDHLILLLITSVVGALIGFLIAQASWAGYLDLWQHLDNPPEKAVGLITGGVGELWVLAQSERIYHYADTLACAQNCWELSESPKTFEVRLLTCQDHDPRPLFWPFNVIISRRVCSPWGYTLGNAYYIYAITGSGEVYVWTHYTSEGDWQVCISGPFLGIFIAGLFGEVGLPLLVAVFADVKMLLSRMRRRR